jgi:hypothetical protein
MLDVLMIAVAIGFFAACLAYTAGCQRLLERRTGKDQAEPGN